MGVECLKKGAMNRGRLRNTDFIYLAKCLRLHA